MPCMLQLFVVLRSELVQRLPGIVLACQKNNAGGRESERPQLLECGIECHLCLLPNELGKCKVPYRGKFWELQIFV